MIHTYSLVHDDLPAMDDDDLRRGKPTAHRVFGEALAILAGDALLTQAFTLLVDIPADWDTPRIARRTRATSLLARACASTGLIGGQVDDLAHEGRTVDATILERIHRAKTGALLEASVSGGALLGRRRRRSARGHRRLWPRDGPRVPDRRRRARRDRAVGEAGQDGGKGPCHGKATYVSVHGIEAARGRASVLLQEALESLTPLGDAADALRQLAHWIVERER